MSKRDSTDNEKQALRHRSDLGEVIFQRMPMGIAILDRAYRIQRYNPTWTEFSLKYAPPGSKPLSPGVNYFDHIPGSEPIVLPLYERVLAGETIYQDGVRLEAGGIISFWDVVLAPLVDGEEIIGILNVSVDATERVQLQQNLEHRVEKRTQELERRREIAESLRDIISMINARLPLDTFLERGVKIATQRLEAAACVLHQFDVENQVIYNLASFGMDNLVTRGTAIPFKDLFSNGEKDYLKATLEKQPTYANYPPLPERVEEIQRDARIPEPFKSARVAIRQRFAGSFSVPIFIHKQIYGGMVFYYTEPQEFSNDQIQLGLTFAEQVGIAIENARLHQIDQDRQRELQMLLDVAATANSSLNLDDLLTKTLDLLVTLVDASRAGISLLDEKTGYLLPSVLRPKGSVDQEDMAKMMGAGQAVIENGEMMYIAPESSKELHEPGALLPLQIRGRNIGILGIIGQKGSLFSPDQLTLFKSIADQLGVAIENARLFEQAEVAAVTAERSRLARDLHDAVTQTLFSASLISDVLPKIWERDPKEGERRLEELRQLTRGALSEMRTLLVELRPAALADTSLEDLIRHQVNAFIARTRLPVEYHPDSKGNLPVEIKEMFYRIVQEGLNNIAKHADASTVFLQLGYQSDRASLVIKDDGIGFDFRSTDIEGLGLGIMQERARNLGAQIKINSRIGAGTRLSVLWQASDKKENIND